MISSTISRSVLRVALVAGLALGAAAPTLAAAQEQGSATVRGEGRGHHPGRRGRGHHGRGHGPMRMLEQLDLTDNQRAQIRAIAESAHERKMELAAAGRSDETRAQLRALHRETRELIQDVLTPDQLRRAAALRAAHRREHLSRKVDMLTERLSLTDSQAARVRAIFEAGGERIGALHDSSESREDAREAMRTLRDEIDQQVRAVLTAAQRTEFDTMRAEHGRRGPRGSRRGH